MKVMPSLLRLFLHSLFLEASIHEIGQEISRIKQATKDKITGYKVKLAKSGKFEKSIPR